MNKNGQIDLFLVLVVLFTIGIFLFVIFLTLDKINDSGIFDGYTNAEEVYSSGRSALLGFDNIMLFILVGLSLFVLISSAFIFNHPAFTIFAVILLALAILIAGTVSNTWFDFSTNSEIEGATSNYPKTNFLLRHLPQYILIMGIASIISAMVGFRNFG